MASSRRLRYSLWDGSQEDQFPSADALMEQLAEDLMQYGDLRSALRSGSRRSVATSTWSWTLRTGSTEVRRAERTSAVKSE